MSIVPNLKYMIIRNIILKISSNLVCLGKRSWLINQNHDKMVATHLFVTNSLSCFKTLWRQCSYVHFIETITLNFIRYKFLSSYEITLYVSLRLFLFVLSLNNDKCFTRLRPTINTNNTKLKVECEINIFDLVPYKCFP